MYHLLLVAFAFFATGVEGGPRSRAGDEHSETTCVPCSYMDLEEVCFPFERLPHGSKWTCLRHYEEEIQDESVWDCLMAGTDSESCTQNSKGSCVWCAEPVFGLCVTPQVAERIGNLPYFECESPSWNTQ
jgi:hypothetical protein